MKKNIFTILLVLLTVLNSASQTTTEAVTGSVIYAGIDNPIRVISNEIGCGLEALTISCDSEFTFFGDSCNYNINPKAAGIDVVVSVWAVNANTGKKVALSRKTFKVEELPPPLLCLGPLEPSSGVIQISRRELSGNFLNARVESGFPLDLNYKILSFTVSAKKNGKTINYQCETNYSSDARSFLSTLKPNNTFTISNIRVKGPNEQIQVIESLSVKVVQ